MVILAQSKDRMQENTACMTAQSEKHHSPCPSEISWFETFHLFNPYTNKKLLKKKIVILWRLRAENICQPVDRGSDFKTHKI